MTEPTLPTDAALFKALKDLVVEAQAVADDHHRPRYARLDQTLASARNAMLDYWAATPQPTQPQAGAVPLTCEWTHNEDDGFWETACGEAWRFDDGGPGENNMHFCHSCGNSLRIKGGQHVS